MFFIRLRLQKHQYKYLPYNMTNKKLAQELIQCNICYITNGNKRNANRKSFKLNTHNNINPNASPQSYTFGGCGLKLETMTVRFIM
jgi:hypothetical protein